MSARFAPDLPASIVAGYRSGDSVEKLVFRYAATREQVIAILEAAGEAVTAYNPFPEVTDVAPVWTNSGVCYSRALYLDREVALKVAEHVAASGGTVNGGYLHGAPLGAVTEVTTAKGGPGWEVTY